MDIAKMWDDKFDGWVVTKHSMDQIERRLEQYRQLVKKYRKVKVNDGWVEEYRDALFEHRLTVRCTNQDLDDIIASFDDAGIPISKYERRGICSED